ncbi:MAG: ABC transporter ATP-binding protein [Pseudomonadota bacterium]
MIVFENVSKRFRAYGKTKVIVEDASVTIPDGARVGLLGRNGAGKSTLLRLMAGIVSPDQGRIHRTREVSWPLGFRGSFHQALTGAQNVRFVARVYGRDTRELSEFVEEFAELGDYFHMPVRSYSSGMRARLAFGVSMGISFGCYLVDEITSVGDADFKRKAQEAFDTRLAKADLIMVSHSAPMLRRFCQSGILLSQQGLTYYEDLEEAIEVHEASMAG